MPLVQLIEAEGKPYDFVLCGDPRRYAYLLVPTGLAEIAAYARAIGPSKDVLIPHVQDGSRGQPTTIVADAHAAGLLVHAWTFRAENAFLPTASRTGTDPAALGVSTASFRPSSISASMVSSPIIRGSPCARCEGRR